jgi:glycosyltransferase involved in cell wall biosynthesis
VALHILTAFGLARQIQRDGVDRMHAHFATASTMALVAHVLTNVPFSFTAHASADIYIYSPFLFQKLRQAWRVVAISDYNRRYLELISGYSLPPATVVMVFNGVELPELGNQTKDNAQPLLFTSAAFVEFKGYGTLLEALALLQRDGVDFHFLAVGGGPLFDVMQARVRELGLVEQVSLLGSRPFSEVQKWLASADIFVFPAEIGLNGQRDGMPTAITEALAYGLPVVATHITGIPQQVRDGVNGFLVEERDPVALATRLRQLLESPETRSRMGREGRRLAEDRFDLRLTLDQLGVALLDAGVVSK